MNIVKIGEPYGSYPGEVRVEATEEDLMPGQEPDEIKVVRVPLTSEAVNEDGAYNLDEIIRQVDAAINPLVKFFRSHTGSGLQNVWVGQIEVKGQKFDLEMDAEKTWLHIMEVLENDMHGACEVCVIDADEDVISDAGEVVTQDWTDADWVRLAKSVKAVISKR